MRAETMGRGRAIVAGVLLVPATWLTVAGCKESSNPQGGAAAPASAAPSAPAAPAPRASPPESPASDELRPVYPVDAGPPDPLAQRFCDAIYALPARRAGECCGRAAPVGITLGEQCVRMLSYAMATRAVRVAPAGVDACADAMAKATSGCDWVTLTTSVALPPACEGVLEGQLADKATCRSSLECAKGLRCLGLSAIDLGTCGAPKPTGQPCDLANDMLAVFTRQDHYGREHPECEGHCAGKRCQPPLPEGGACTTDTQCGKLRCERGKCTAAPLPGAGGPCSVECAYGLRCVGGTCVAPKNEGEACKGDVECRGQCVPGDAGAGGTCIKTCTIPPFDKPRVVPKR